MKTPHSRHLERFTRTLSQLAEAEVHVNKPRQLRLRVAEDGNETEATHRGPKIIIGAHARADVKLASASASALHCELEITQDGRVVLRDLGSKNGTQITDNIRLVHEAILSPGASFVVGGARVQLLGVSDDAIPISTTPRFGALLGRGAEMGELFALLSRIASNDIDVLVLGETGTGKEVVANGIHAASARAEGPFVTLDCTTIPKELAESTLFGHKKGSFTGATADARGVFERANGGTLFIDEIGDLPLDLQAKLLRALQNRTTQRIGDEHSRPFDARIIAATRRDLRKLVNEGRFREDLFFRLGIVEVLVPPLRERDTSNISMLADHFLEECSATRGDALRFTRDAYAALKAHPWPGNVRELRATIMATSAMAGGPEVATSDLRFRGFGPSTKPAPPPIDTDRPLDEAREDFDRRYLTALLERTGGNRSEAARLAGKSRNGLLQMLKRLGLG